MPHVGRPIIRRSFGRIVFEGPYDAGWVAAIKLLIPSGDRKYDRTIWDFDPRWYGCVREVTEHFYGSRYIDSTGGVSEPQLSSWKEKWAANKETLGSQAKRERESRREEAPPPRAYRTRLSEAYATLYVTEAAPAEVVTAAYRVLSGIHHPDRGGDVEVMQRINAAYQELKKHGRVK